MNIVEEHYVYFHLKFTFSKDLENNTGWSILFLYTLHSSYNKNNICTKRIVADKCSVYRGISSKTIVKISKLQGKKLN